MYPKYTCSHSRSQFGNCSCHKEKSLGDQHRKARIQGTKKEWKRVKTSLSIDLSVRKSEEEAHSTTHCSDNLSSQNRLFCYVSGFGLQAFCWKQTFLFPQFWDPCTLQCCYGFLWPFTVWTFVLLVLLCSLEWKGKETRQRAHCISYFYKNQFWWTYKVWKCCLKVRGFQYNPYPLPFCSSALVSVAVARGFGWDWGNTDSNIQLVQVLAMEDTEFPPSDPLMNIESKWTICELGIIYFIIIPPPFVALCVTPRWVPTNITATIQYS